MYIYTKNIGIKIIITFRTKTQTQLYRILSIVLYTYTMRYYGPKSITLQYLFLKSLFITIFYFFNLSQQPTSDKKRSHQIKRQHAKPKFNLANTNQLSRIRNIHKILPITKSYNMNVWMNSVYQRKQNCDKQRTIPPNNNNTFVTLVQNKERKERDRYLANTQMQQFFPDYTLDNGIHTITPTTDNYVMYYMFILFTYIDYLRRALSIPSVILSKKQTMYVITILLRTQNIKHQIEFKNRKKSSQES
eukprot:TRINITY_DN271_c0_g1_i2.p1 TRINITY_DN271_c0_g1~~TRINITY_DN271_c0_g1_i2.p1  ORF type:complete len:247 (+),score=-24.30 TRINITY_DN271_c0_g1_i2:372-1112(+)